MATAVTSTLSPTQSTYSYGTYTAIPTDTNLCTLETCPISLANFTYLPTVPGNIVYLVIFALILFAQIFFGVRHKTWSFLGGMFGGLVLEVLGYVGRVLDHYSPFNFNWFLLYLIPITIGPAFLSASIYFTLGRIILINGAHISRLSPKVYKIIFITCDFFSLVLQAAGGGIAATADTKSTTDAGVNIMIAGLAFQVFSLALFIAFWSELYCRWSKRRSEQPAATASLRNSRKYKGMEIALILATILIFVRSTYRVAELQGGFSGKVANNEPTFMIFEGPMIIIATGALTVFHPGTVLGALWKAKATDVSLDANGYGMQHAGFEYEAERKGTGAPSGDGVLV